jgi:hypothetical protein
MKEFAFDLKLIAIARIKAETEAEAREILEGIVEINLNHDGGDYRLTEASISPGSGFLFEVDGECV